MKFLSALLMIPLLGLPAQEGAVLSPESPPEGERFAAEPPHDLHATYGNLGVDGSIAILQLRAFKNDLEEALQRFHGLEGFQLDVSPVTDALFLRYFVENFVLEVDGQPLKGQIVGSGDDELDREPVWWYQVRFDASGPIEAARITNKIFFEIFDDQSNVMRVVKFPEGARRAYYFAPGEETLDISF